MPQLSITFNIEGAWVKKAIYDNSAGLDDSVSYGSHTYNAISETANGFDAVSPVVS